MRYIHFFGDAGFCGTDYHYFKKFTDDTSNNVLDEISENYRQDNAESFEYLATGWDGDFEDEQERESYYEGANGAWEELPTKDEYEKMREDYE